VELVCSARSAEVHAATGSGRVEYISTLKGRPRDGLWAFSLVYPPVRAGDPAARAAITLRLLALAVPGKLELRSVLPARRGTGAPLPAAQAEQVRARLESLAEVAGGGVPRAALMASIARSVLDQSARGGGAGGAAVAAAAEAPELSLRRLAAEVAAQGAALARVEAAVAALRATADETAALVRRLAAAQSGGA
jgi:hypothetical protein